MARVRVSTTVDEQLLAEARRVRSELADSALLDEALAALLARNRAVEIDAAFAAYDRTAPHWTRGTNGEISTPSEGRQRIS